MKTALNSAMAKDCMVSKTLATFLTNEKQDQTNRDLNAFSRACRRLHVFTLNSDWFIALFAFVVIGQSFLCGFVLRHSLENC